jgi:hypothetical protein
MNLSDNVKRSQIIGQIRDLIPNTSSFTDPFLYYLPNLLTSAEFKNINAEKTLDFVRLAVKYEKPQIVIDALKILNQLIDPQVGTLKRPDKEFFYENNNFFWKELGGYTESPDVIMHILNKTLFVITVGKA